jgi:hypothetical protein
VTTMAIGYVLLQVFSIDYVQAITADQLQP